MTNVTDVVAISKTGKHIKTISLTFQPTDRQARQAHTLSKSGGKATLVWRTS
jgi:hypothetical protein